MEKTFSIREALASSWHIMWKNIRLLGSAVLFASLLFYILDTLDALLESTLSNQSAIVYLVSEVVLFALSALLTSFIVVSLLRIFLGAVDEKRRSLREFLTAHVFTLRAFLVIALLQFLITIAALPPVFAIYLLYLRNLMPKLQQVFNETDSDRAADLLRQAFSNTEGLYPALFFLVLLIAIVTYLSLRFQFALYSVVDKGSGPVQAMRNSWAMSDSVLLKLLLLYLVIVSILFATLVISGLVYLLSYELLPSLIGVATGMIFSALLFLIFFTFTALLQAWVYRTVEQQSNS